MSKDTYESPLASRYASEYMPGNLFSPDMRFPDVAQTVVALGRRARAGSLITQEQVDELRCAHYRPSTTRSPKSASTVRHDVMAHVYGSSGASAAGNIHLAHLARDGQRRFGALSRRPWGHLRGQLSCVMVNLAAFAREYAATPTPGYTHYQLAARDDRQARRCDAGLPLGPKSLILSSARCVSPRHDGHGGELSPEATVTWSTMNAASPRGVRLKASSAARPIRERPTAVF